MSETFHSLAPVDPEISEVMATAFDAAWASLCASGARLSAQQACEARVSLARSILDQVHCGERDPSTLRTHALAELADTRGAIFVPAL